VAGDQWPVIGRAIADFTLGREKYRPPTTDHRPPTTDH